MGKFRVWAGMAWALAAATLVGCGGNNSSNTANLRLVNATLTHASITLLANSTSVIAATPLDTVSSYSGVSTGSPALQINDATSGTVLATTAPSLAGGQHYALVAYESGGTLRTAVIGEDTAAPISGTAVLRLFNTATDAGAIDVYVTDPSVDISTLSSPTFSFAASSSTQASAFLSFAPGTYRVQVTGAGNTSDLRLDMGASVTLASQQIDTVILTPTTGGTLVNGSVLIQQAAYAASRNTNSRVRLAAAVSGNALVTATAGAPLGNIGLNVVAPSVGGYVVVPAGSAIAVGVNGNSVGSPVGALTAGSDNTLLVYGNPATAVASIVVDDNHLPALSTNLKIRMLNGLTGASPPPLTLEANFAIVANNVLPGTASAYSVVAVATASTTSLAVYSPSSVANLYPGGSGLTLPPNAVYTLFMLGDQGAPLPVLRKDR